MRCRAGPLGGLVLIVAILILAVANVGCATVAKVGEVLHSAGDTISAVGDVLCEGAADDMKSGTDTIGITAPAAPPAPPPAATPPPNSALAPDEHVITYSPAFRGRVRPTASGHRTTIALHWTPTGSPDLYRRRT